MISLYELEGMVIDIANKYYHISDTRRVFHDYEDYIQEARIAAFKAIKNYRQDRKTKVSTFVYNCVENRFKDMHRYAMRKKRPTLYFYDDFFVENFASENFYYDDYDRINREITVRKILNGEEYELYLRIMQGYRIYEIEKHSNKKKNELKECFTRILQKLESHGMSLSA